MSPRKYKSIDLHRLEQHSLGKCNICQEDLIKEDKPGTYYYNGNIAHIRDVKPGHRHDPQMNDAESDSFDNLLLICVSCHKKIDGSETWKNYPVEKLNEYKEAAERRFEELTGDDSISWINNLKNQDSFIPCLTGLALFSVDGNDLEEINGNAQMLNNFFLNWVNVSPAVRSFGASVCAIGKTTNGVMRAQISELRSQFGYSKNDIHDWAAALENECLGFLDQDDKNNVPYIALNDHDYFLEEVQKTFRGTNRHEVIETIFRLKLTPLDDWE